MMILRTRSNGGQFPSKLLSSFLLNGNHPQDEEQWWTARNSLGQTGSIPVPYVAKVSRQLPLLFDVDIYHHGQVKGRSKGVKSFHESSKASIKTLSTPLSSAIFPPIVLSSCADPPSRGVGNFCAHRLSVLHLSKDVC